MLVIHNKSTSIHIVKENTFNDAVIFNSFGKPFFGEKYKTAGTFQGEGVKCLVAVGYVSGGRYVSQGRWTLEPGDSIVPELHYNPSGSELYINVIPFGGYTIKQPIHYPGMKVTNHIYFSCKFYYGSKKVGSSSCEFEVDNNSFTKIDAKRAKKGFWATLKEDLFSGKFFQSFYEVGLRDDIPLSIEWTATESSIAMLHYHVHRPL